jgi:hypothetical protein
MTPILPLSHAPSSLSSIDRSELPSARPAVEDEIAVLLSAPDRQSLARRIEDFRERIESNAPSTLDEVAALLDPRPLPSAYRAGIAVRSIEDLVRGLDGLAEAIDDPECDQIDEPGVCYFRTGPIDEAERVAFLFPGLAPSDTGARADGSHQVPRGPYSGSSPRPRELLMQRDLERRLHRFHVHPSAVAGWRGGEMLALAVAGAIEVGADFPEGLQRLERLLTTQLSRQKRPIRGLFDSLVFAQTSIPVYSIGHQKRLTPRDRDLRELDVDPVVDPSAKWSLIQAMTRDGIRIFVELSTRGELTRHAFATADESEWTILSAGTGGVLETADLVARLFVRGVDLSGVPKPPRRSDPAVLDSPSLPGWLLGQSAILEYLQTMDLFLDTQHQVMKNYLERAAKELAELGVGSSSSSV